MNHEQLASLRNPETTVTKSPGTRRLPAAALPVGLALAFLVVFALLFGSRLLPAVPVEVAPVIALRTDASPGDPPAAEPAETTPDTSAVAPEGSALLFQASGWVEPDPFVTFVPTLLSGVVHEVHVLEGQSVKEGDLLATLIDDDAKLDLQEARQKVETLNATQVAHCAALPVLEAEINSAEKKIDAEEARLAEFRDIAQRLSTSGKRAVSERDIIQARLQVQRQEAALEEARGEIPRLRAQMEKINLERVAVEARIEEARTELARKDLAFQRTRITAPMDGIVLRLHAAPGKKRMPEMDDPDSTVIVELYDPEKLQARIDVPLAEAAGLAVGQPVRLTTDLLPGAKFNGTVTRIVGEADIQRNTLQSKVRILRPDPRLRPGMLVRAEFFRGSATSGQPRPPGSLAAGASSPARLALYAPVAALVNRSERTAQAWVVDRKRASLRDLTLGTASRDGHLHVLEGLRPGDQLILPPHQKLEPGKRLKVTD